MANSKANIYPVQLQGAELNLNKYDAEIKQYSGFNKNNAPFVGGCLSNLFIKDDNTLDSPSRTFIDPEGNIYHITQNGLFKNDIYVERFPTNRVFWEREELENTADTIRYFNDTYKLIKVYESDKWYYKLQRNKTGTSVTALFNNLLSFSEYEEDLICFNNTTGIFIEINSVRYFVFVCAFNNAARLLVLDGSTVISDVNINVSGFVDMDTPVSIIYDSTHSQILVFYAGIDNLGNSTTYCNAYSIDSEGELTLLVNGVTAFGDTGLFFKKFKNYHFLSYPYNKAILKCASSDDTVSGTSGALKVTFSDLYYASSKVTFTTSQDSGYPNAANYNIASGVAFDRDLVIDNGTFTSLLGCFDFQGALAPGYMAIHNTMDSKAVLGFSFYKYDYKGSSRGACRYVLGDTVSLGDTFKLYFNNNNLSAIGGESVLLTEFNTVKANSLTYYRNSQSTRYGYVDERLYYKENGKWYCLKHGLFNLKVIENQIVTNFDGLQNAYDYKRNKLLNFAPMFYPVYDSTSTVGAYYNRDNTYDNYYIGFAINEYNQKDNSSIILNPVSIYDNTHTSYRSFLTGSKSIVNVYIGTASEIIYSGSIGYSGLRNTNYFINEELKGLPFPIDANGNVQYSPSLFCETFSSFGNDVFIKFGSNVYQLSKYNNEVVMSFYLGTLIENLEDVFILQGQYYGIINNQIFAIQFVNGVVSSVYSIVSVQGMKFCGGTPYEALFFSETNRTIYSFTGANVLNTKQFVDKISEVRGYKYNPSTHSIFLFTDIGVIVYSLFGIYQIDFICDGLFLLEKGVVLYHDDEVNPSYKYIKYYKSLADTGYTKQNIELETMFYGSTNELVTINDCLYMRFFSPEHESGNIDVTATTISNEGKSTEKTTFKINSSEWDDKTDTIYIRYQPKEQRGLGISFNIISPFKIAALSVGSILDTVLIDKVSKKAINAPFVNNDVEW